MHYSVKQLPWHTDAEISWLRESGTSQLQPTMTKEAEFLEKIIMQSFYGTMPETLIMLSGDVL